MEVNEVMAVFTPGRKFRLVETIDKLNNDAPLESQQVITVVTVDATAGITLKADTDENGVALDEPPETFKWENWKVTEVNAPLYQVEVIFIGTAKPFIVEVL